MRLATFECALDDGEYAACSSPFEVSGLVVGGHEFAVRATDTAGNTDATPAVHTWTVVDPADITAPQTTVDSGPPEVTEAVSATFDVLRG